MLTLRKFVAPEFVFGQGALSLVGRQAAGLGVRRALVVVDPGLFAFAWPDKVRESLGQAGVDVRIFSAFSSNPRDTEVMRFAINTSPFVGREGKFVQSAKLRERLYKETLRNVAIQVDETDDKDSFTVKGRGEFQMAILVETMSARVVSHSTSSRLSRRRIFRASAPDVAVRRWGMRACLRKSRSMRAWPSLAAATRAEAKGGTGR